LILRPPYVILFVRGIDKMDIEFQKMSRVGLGNVEVGVVVWRHGSAAPCSKREYAGGVSPRIAKLRGDRSSRRRRAAQRGGPKADSESRYAQVCQRTAVWGSLACPSKGSRYGR